MKLAKRQGLPKLPSQSRSSLRDAVIELSIDKRNIQREELERELKAGLTLWSGDLLKIEICDLDIIATITMQSGEVLRQHPIRHSTFRNYIRIGKRVGDWSTRRGYFQKRKIQKVLIENEGALFRGINNSFPDERWSVSDQEWLPYTGSVPKPAWWGDVITEAEAEEYKRPI